jgi:hypothetical protein
MKRAHWLWCGGGLLALVVVLLIAGVSAASALLIAALVACPLMMLSMLGASRPETDHEPTPSGLPPSQIPVDTERSLP